MAEVGGSQPRSHGKGKKKKMKRIGVRLDMTPMVDVAFLLLTFFMLTTAFRLPQTMEISIPPEEDAKEKEQVKIAESNVLQLLATADNLLYYIAGKEPPKKTTLKGLRKVIIDASEKNIDEGKGNTLKEKYRLIVLIKIDDKSKYENMINIVDELDLAMNDLNIKLKLTERTTKLSPRFAFAPFTDLEREEVRKVQ